MRILFASFSECTCQCQHGDETVCGDKASVHSVVTSLGVALVLLRHSVQLAAVMATDVVLQLVVSYPVELDNVSVLAAQASRW